MRKESGVEWPAFVDLLGVKRNTLERWLNGDLPSRPYFRRLIRGWSSTGVFTSEACDVLIKSYNRDADMQIYENARIRDAQIRLPPENRTPFTLALERVHTDLRISWREVGLLIGVKERTLRGWLEGSVPAESSFDKMVAQMSESNSLPTNHLRALVTGYMRTVQPFPKPDIVVYGGQEVGFNTGVTFDPEHSSIRIASPPPKAPQQTSPGPTLRPTNTGFDIAIHPPPEVEREDQELQRLHQELCRLAENLAASMPRISNTHKELADQFAAYAKFLASDLKDLDITSFWAIGTGLGAHIRALNRAGPSVMTPELEPALIAQFETLTAFHAAFILGFSAAREMQARIAQARAAAQDDPALPTLVQSILISMAKTPHLLAERALSLVDALARGIPAVPDAALDVLAGRYETARNGNHAFMRALQPIIEVAGAVGVISYGNTVLSGEQVDLMQVTASYINAHMQDIMALYRNDQITTDWLRWAHQRLQRRDG